MKPIKVQSAALAFSLTLASGSFATVFASMATYTVQPGDTYYSIGKAVHQPYAVLQAINSPSQSTLQPGQVVRLAEAYTVQPGDTVWKIATSHNVRPTDVIAWNHLTHPDVIQPGSTLWLAAGASTPAVSVNTDSRRNQIVAYAKQFIGAPYRWGGSTAAGFDCSGFTAAVFSHFNISLPRTATAQHSVGTAVSRAELQPGDLVFFNTTGAVYSHVGIYIGGGQFISATTSHGVMVSDMDHSTYWGPRYTGATDPLV